jgi:hypothetical protein
MDTLDEKIKIREQINTFSEDLLTGTITSIIDSLKEFEKDFLEKGFTDIELDMQEYCESTEIIATGMRLENDREYKERLEFIIDKLQHEKEKRERDFKKYQKLKLKFEKPE